MPGRNGGCPQTVVGKLDPPPIPSAPSARPGRAPGEGGRASRGADLRAGGLLSVLHATRSCSARRRRHQLRPPSRRRRRARAGGWGGGALDVVRNPRSRKSIFFWLWVARAWRVLFPLDIELDGPSLSYRSEGKRRVQRLRRALLRDRYGVEVRRVDIAGRSLPDGLTPLTGATVTGATTSGAPVTGAVTGAAVTGANEGSGGHANFNTKWGAGKKTRLTLSTLAEQHSSQAQRSLPQRSRAQYSDMPYKTGCSTVTD
eukprot:gene1785-biopygen6365